MSSTVAVQSGDDEAMGRGRIGRLVLGSGLAAVAVVIPVVGGAGTGEVDPAGVVLGLVGLLMGACLALPALVWQDTDHVGLADRLAVEVRQREEEARQRLLGGSDRIIDLEFVFVPASAHNADGADTHGTLQEVLGFYRKLSPGRLVITGAPGAGKTILALQLVLLLLADRESDGPVPVRLSLSAFDPHRHSLQEWVADQLTRIYRLRPKAAAALVAARLVLPILDGLDEMDADGTPVYSSRAAATLASMNAYLHGTAKGQAVITCRSASYAALEAVEVWAQDAARIDISPVSPNGARAFIVSRTSDRTRWQPVLDVIRANPTSPLAQALSTPWRLTVAVAVYDERHPDSGARVRDPRDLLSPALQSLDRIRDHLLDLFIRSATVPRFFPSQAGVWPLPYTSQQVRSWLTVLARYLHTNATTTRKVSGRELSGSDLVLHELWPLVGDHRVRLTAALVPAAPWLTWALVVLCGGLITRSPLFIASAIIIIAALLGAASWAEAWPEPEQTDLRRLKTAQGKRSLATGFWLGLLIGVGLGVVVGTVVGATSGVVAGSLIGLISVLMMGLPLGIALGLARGFVVTEVAGGAGPRRLMQRDLFSVPLFGVALMFSGVVTLGLVFTAAPESDTVEGASVFVLMGEIVLVIVSGMAFMLISMGAGIVVLFALGPASGYAVEPLRRLLSGSPRGERRSWGGVLGLRYLALLLWTRRLSGRELPWRLGRFLDWCCEVGLMRTAGIAYQFRHQELQDFLARSDP